MVRGASWKLPEIKLVRKFYPNYEKERLLKLLPNRTWRAISDEAQRLGIEVNRRGLAKTFRYYSSNVKIGSLGEKFVKALLEREGCKVYDFKMVDNIKDNNIKKLAQAKKFVRTVDARSYVPDYMAFKGNQAFVVEVKTGQSTLYPSQRKILLKSLDYGLIPLIVKVMAYKYSPSRKN